MYTFYDNYYYVYLCVYIVMHDYLCVYIVMSDYIFTVCVKCPKNTNNYIHCYISVCMILF